MAARLDLKRFWRDERGATAIEYALICSLIFVVIVTGVTTFANRTVNLMQIISDAVDRAIGT